MFKKTKFKVKASDNKNDSKDLYQDKLEYWFGYPLGYDRSFVLSNEFSFVNLNFIANLC